MGVRYKLSFLIILFLAVSTIEVNTANALTSTYIELYYGNEVFIYKDEYIEPENHIVAEQIFERKINAPLNEKLEFIRRKLKGGADYKSAMLTCFPLLKNTVDEAIEKLNRDPVDSEIKFYPSSKPMFIISRERSGVKVLEDRLYMDIFFALSVSSTPKIRIPVERPEAKIKTDDNIALTKMRARYSTDFTSSTEERKHNIRLALSKINGKVIFSGETMSFNDTVGRRTAKNGFLEAKIIKGGKYVPGYGGGVCQASTTLYNAALLSDLSIVSVSRHSLQSSYELPSFDAMVNSGSSDLKIRNDGDKQVFIKAYTDGNRAYVEIYGSKLPYTIKRKSEVTFTGKTPEYEEVLDETMQYFDEGTESGAKKTVSYSHPEVHSNGYLLYYDLNGALIEKKLIRSDVYSAVKGVVAVAP